MITLTGVLLRYVWYRFPLKAAASYSTTQRCTEVACAVLIGAMLRWPTAPYRITQLGHLEELHMSAHWQRYELELWGSAQTEPEVQGSAAALLKA